MSKTFGELLIESAVRDARRERLLQWLGIVALLVIIGAALKYLVS